MTCRHFRYQVPREDADELRDADPEPCRVCDALPHRKAMARGSAATLTQRDDWQGMVRSGWLVEWFGGKREEAQPAAGFSAPVHAAA